MFNVHIHEETVVGQFALDFLLLIGLITTMDEQHLRQTCKVCGRHDKFNFHVPDEVWKAVVPLEYQVLVVCLDCFDRFATEGRIEYAESLQLLYFAGDKAVFEFKVISATSVLS